VNAKARPNYTGHANIAITLDRHGHLLPGNEAEAAGLLDAYLDISAAAGSDGPGWSPVVAVHGACRIALSSSVASASRDRRIRVNQRLSGYWAGDV
jgi:hypothetical protein